jgi:two-component system nitrate/nitrite response regulator NarL
LKVVVERTGEFALVGSTPDLTAALRDIEAIQPDILVIGQPHTARTMLPLLAELRHSSVTARVVLWAGDVSELETFRALQLGARAVIRKTQPPDTFIDCIRAVAQGGVWAESASHSGRAHPRRKSTPRITSREREIIIHVCRGMKNKEIAEALAITAGTVKVHLMHIFEKTGVKDRLQLALNGPQLLNALESQNGDSENHSA